MCRLMEIQSRPRALLAAQQGIVFMGRTGLDITTLTATARSLTARLLPNA
jgi:TetR/AcrR family transcriptional repressor of nem operon